jgi:hypothetical protein
MEPHIVIISFRPIQLKLFRSKKKSLLVIEAACVNGSENRIAPGNASLIHIRHTTLLADVLTSDGIVDDCTSAVAKVAHSLLASRDSILFLHKGAWVPASTSKILILAVIVNMERNRKGTRIVECTNLICIRCQDDEPYFPIDEKSKFNEYLINQGSSQAEHINYKTERHKLFARWVVQTFGVEVLSQGSGVVDVAGGNGMISQTLVTEFGVKSTLLDPNPRCDNSQDSFGVIPRALNGDGRDLTNCQDDIAQIIQQSSLICGLHPDQATEPIISLALRLNKRFAVVPCCVMPSSFPHRVQRRHGDPVRSYSAFCRYLLDMAKEGEEFEVEYLNFVGRNKVIYRKL